MDDERLFAHGRDRMRHREVSACSSGRQHSRRRRHADVPKSLGTYPDKMPKKGRGKSDELDPLSFRRNCRRAGSALRTLRKDFRSVEESGIPVPPCFIIVCNNTSTSKLVYDLSPASTAKTKMGPQRWKMADSRSSATSMSMGIRLLVQIPADR